MVARARLLRAEEPTPYGWRCEFAARRDILHGSSAASSLAQQPALFELLRLVEVIARGRHREPGRSQPRRSAAARTALARLVPSVLFARPRAMARIKEPGAVATRRRSGLRRLLGEEEAAVDGDVGHCCELAGAGEEASAPGGEQRFT